MLAVLHAMAYGPEQGLIADQIAQGTGLERRTMNAALGALMNRDWADTDYRRVRQRGHVIYTLTDDGYHEAATILRDPTAGIPQLVQERLRASRLPQRDRAVLNALVADGFGSSWTLPTIERRVLVAGLPHTRTTRNVCAELTRLLWRGWIAIQPNQRHFLMCLTRSGYEDACTHLHDTGGQVTR